jgi:hypothetical protein
LDDLAKRIGKLIVDAANKIKDAGKVVDEMISGFLQDAAAAFAEGMANIFTGGNFLAPLLQSIGGSLEALGKYVIKTAIIVSGIGEALNKAIKGNPALAVAAGIALIALGRLAENVAMKNAPHFATGGVVTRPTLALVGEQGPERITPLNQISNSGNNIIAGEVVFTISGQNLRGTLRRADNTANNIYGN